MPHSTAVAAADVATRSAVDASPTVQARGGSPGEVSRLAACLQGLALAEGTAAGWCMALKPPKSSQLVLVDCAAGGQWQEMAADDWLRRVLLPAQGWTGWVCYNDETPEGSTASGTKFGHCKGILAWRQDRIAWLVHSVPAWPEAMSNESLPPLVASGLRCGQSFLFLSLPRTGDLLRRICDQIKLMDACCYTGRVPPDEEAHVPFREDRWGEHLAKPYKLQAPTLVPLAPGVWHLAKDAAWGKRWVDGRPTDLDFYEDGLARTPPFEGFWHVQSWLNGNCPPFGRTAHCDNILQIRLPDGQPYETAKDHAKWAVHRERPLVLIGDLNRTQTQAKRGGGGVVLEDEGLWRALTSVVHHVGADHPPPPLPPPLVSYDEFHSAGLSGGSGRAGAGRLLQAQVGTPGGRARQPRQGRRHASTAAAQAAGSEGGGEADSGSEGVAPVASVRSSSSAGQGGSKGCNCKTGCGHGRCGCKRAGQPCGAHCNCKGACANNANGAAAEALEAAPGAAAAVVQEASSGGAAGEPAAAAPPPEVAAAAIGAAIERLAAAAAAAAAVSTIAPVVQQQQADHIAAAAAPAQGDTPADAATPAASGMATSQQTGGGGGGVSPASAGERCSCSKGCKDRRCPCRKAGRQCGECCECQGCTNCGGAAAPVGGTRHGGAAAARGQEGCTVS